MVSAQRRVRRAKSKVKSRNTSILIKVLIPVIVVVSLFLFLRLSTKYWDGHNKVSYVFQEPSGDTGIIVLDPVLTEETTFTIPGGTQVDVARGYGQFRIKNVWQLGLNEKLGGGLLAQTVTDDFLFPTTLWSERDLSNLWQFVFSPGKTNILFGDRLQMALFVLKVKSIDKTEIDLGKNQFLKKQILTDGAPGYVQNGPISGRLTVYFSDNDFANQNLKFGLVNASGNPAITNGVGAILEVLGGKIVSADRQDTNNSLDCNVLGQNSDAVKKVAVLFSCQVISGKSDFDLEMRMGPKFAKRF